MNIHWTINQVTTVSPSDERRNQVVDVRYDVSAEREGIRISNGGSVRLTPDDGFIPFGDLTEETVLGWVHAALGEEGVRHAEFVVTHQLSLQFHPPSTPSPTPLPWKTLA